EEPLPPVFDAEIKPVQEGSLFWKAFSDKFKLRQEDGDVVVYHKHWVVLIQQALRPIAIFLFFLIWFIVRFWSLAQDPTKVVIQFPESGGFIPDTTLVTLLL